MNLKTWFKGLGVFVLSSLITSAAAMTIAPTSFNLTRAGLMKVCSLALIVAIKAVLLYLKQSPLPADPAPPSSGPRPGPGLGAVVTPITAGMAMQRRVA